MTPLAEPADVADAWRPLTDDTEVSRIIRLIRKASAQLRQIMPTIDRRIGLFSTDPTSPLALDPILVADVVATAVRDFVVNPAGAISETQGVGPYSHSVTYAARGINDASRGTLAFSAALLAKLQPTVSESLARRAIRMRPALAPFPLGRYGGPNQLGGDYPDQVVIGQPIHPPVIIEPTYDQYPA